MKIFAHIIDGTAPAYFDPASESREAKQERLSKEVTNGEGEKKEDEESTTAA